MIYSVRCLEHPDFWNLTGHVGLTLYQMYGPFSPSDQNFYIISMFDKEYECSS